MESHAKPTLHIIVTFVAAGKPFDDPAADPAETVGHLKTRVLQYFNLHEGTVVYTLYHGSDPLENMAATLGSIAGPAAALHLKLAQQITQGA